MHDRSIAEIGKLLRTRALTCEALTRMALEAHQPDLMAYREMDAERSIADAKAADAAFRAGRDFGPLQGIPISIKDLYGVFGWSTYAGTSTRLPDAWAHSGPVVQTFLDRLSVVMGKTHTVEFAFSGVGINNHWGTPKNPWDPEHHRIPGGSSSGAGVSLSEGSAKIALGTDTAGSVRIPASMTGNVGLKTTKGRWSTEGIVPLSFTLDTPGVLARTVDDVIVAFEAIDRSAVPSPPELSRIRIGVLSSPFFDDCDAGITEAVTSVVGALAACGAKVSEIDLPEGRAAREVFGAGISAVELYAFLRRSMPDLIDRLDPVVRIRIEDAGSKPAFEYLQRIQEMKQLAAATDERFADFDVLVAPTVACSPPKVAELEDLDVYRRTNMLALRNTAIVSCLGLCAISLPIAKDPNGLPIGLQVIGRAHEDARLLAVARRFEMALGSGAVRLGLCPASH